MHKRSYTYLSRNEIKANFYINIYMYLNSLSIPPVGKEHFSRIIMNTQNYNIFYICASEKYIGMAKFCNEMHPVLPISSIYVAFSGLELSVMHHKYGGFHAFYFDTDEVIIITMLELILISNIRGCSIAVGS